MERIARNALTEKELATCTDRAFKSAGNWVKNRLITEMTKTGIPKDVLKVRVKVSAKDGVGSVWIGLNPLLAKRLGELSQTARGVAASNASFSFFWRSGFVSDSMGGNAFRRRGAARYPIEKIAYEWHGEGERLLRANADKITEKIAAQFPKELDKAMQKALKGI